MRFSVFVRSVRASALAACGCLWLVLGVGVLASAPSATLTPDSLPSQLDHTPATPPHTPPEDLAALFFARFGHREDLLHSATGWAENVTGGAGGAVTWVSSLADSGSGTLREAAESEGPMWIHFAISGKIELFEPIRITSDKTIDGRGASIRLTCQGIIISNVSNVMIEGITVADGKWRDTYFYGSLEKSDDDGIEVTKGSDLIWIDHCYLRSFPDGLIDINIYDDSFSNASLSRVTVSHCLLEDHDKGMLIKGNVASSPNRSDLLRVSLHRNVFSRIAQRVPATNTALVEVTNCVIEGWSGYAVGVSHRGIVRTVGNVFLSSGSASALIWRDEHEGGAALTRLNRYEPSHDGPITPVNGCTRELAESLLGLAPGNLTGATDDEVFAELDSGLPTALPHVLEAPSFELKASVRASAGPLEAIW